MVNPEVYNHDKSEKFIALVLDDIIKAGLILKRREEIETAVKATGRGRLPLDATHGCYHSIHVIET